MDLIYMNSSMEDVGVMPDYDLDIAYGSDENNFECTIDARDHCCEAGYFLYMEGTEYGGEIDSIESDSASRDVIYSGRTWHGILGSKIVIPLKTGETSTADVTVKQSDSSGSLVDRYLILSGDANKIIDYLIDRCALDTLFEASSDTSISITEYKFDRYTDLYSALVKMLAAENYKLNITFVSGKVLLTAIAKENYLQEDEFSSDQVDFQLKKNYKTVNHLICLGKGDLAERQVVHLYVDDDGAISQTQTFTGMDEITDTYDYPSAESEDELIASGEKRLRELTESTELTVDADESTNVYDVGDVVAAVDEITGIRVESVISKKIISMKNGIMSIQYKVGE